MNDLKINEQVSPDDQVLHAHNMLKNFIDKFDTAKRGGIHDFMEMSLYNMVAESIKAIDAYLADGHKRVSGNEVMQIVMDSYQRVLDGMKRNMENVKEVNFR